MKILRRDASNKDFWRVGELAKFTGVSTDTLRHYERKGVLHSRRGSNGYREYPEGALERVRTIRQALAVGFTLNELGAIFKVFDSGGAPCEQVRNLAAKKLSQLEMHLKEVTALRNDLKETLQRWDKHLAKTDPGQRARLLNTLPARAGARSSSSLLLPKPSIEKKGNKHE